MKTEAREAASEQWSANPAGTNHAVALEGTREFYDQMTASRYRLQPWLPSLLRSWVPRGRVLEIGCGAGTDHSVIAGIARDTAAIDLAERGARLTQTRLRLEGRPGVAQVADAECMPFPDASFDGVYSFGVLHHTDHPEQAVAEMRRVMRPGATFMVALYHRHSMFAAQKLLTYLIGMRWLSQSWRDYLPELEYGAAQLQNRPLVRLYSRSSAKQLFSAFHDVRVTTEHPALSGHLLPRRLRPFGWYVIVTGRR
ncbi:class I SAM-dependent methyltransferase [Streptomyces gibsoniae]|uniref:Class I SAM-dependent methyltransferase n=1 Tax=Streptomyces gibsoniae TaxID=3075529 RepID=A0ABU2TVQ5_9ACTN|nr:class I SAM-dependent methyltransferase [Streptomyces sp. DSM 41699]MDT0465051.1 class I SAM-dependent methyltransferase [Streptomyces sp. DSM 41699]